MNGYIEDLSQFSFSVIAEDPSRYPQERTADFHAALDLPEAIFSQIRPILERNQSYQEALEPRIWAHIVIELYAQIIALLDEPDRSSAKNYVDETPKQLRLARMTMIIWMTPELAPASLRTLSASPSTWLPYQQFQPQQSELNEVRARLFDYSEKLLRFQTDFAELFEKVTSKCKSDRAKAFSKPPPV